MSSVQGPFFKLCQECGHFTIHTNGDILTAKCTQCTVRVVKHAETLVDRYRVSEGLDFARNALVDEEMKLPSQPDLFPDFDGEL